MVNCLVLHHHTITSLTKCFVVRAIFHEEEFEIHVDANNTVLVFLWNVPATTIKRAALAFEAAAISIGWGDGKVKVEAENDARNCIHRRIVSGNANHSCRIGEKQENYKLDMAVYM